MEMLQRQVIKSMSQTQNLLHRISVSLAKASASFPNHTDFKVTYSAPYPLDQTARDFLCLHMQGQQTDQCQLEVAVENRTSPGFNPFRLKDGNV